MGATLGRWLVTILLTLSGVFDILYAGFSSFPPLSELPIPAVWWVIGGVTLAAAFGVLRRAPWGRLLAIVVVTFSLGYTIWVEAYWMRGADLSRWAADWHWLSPAIGVGVSSLALWWLMKRWGHDRLGRAGEQD